MLSKYCKCKNTYTRDCDCEDSVWSQGVGSLINQGESNISQTEENRELQNESSLPPASGEGSSVVVKVEDERTIENTSREEEQSEPSFDSGLILSDGLFNDETGISLEAEWTVENGLGVFDASGGGSITFVLSENLENGKNYRLSFDVLNSVDLVRFQVQGYDSGFGYTDQIKGYTSYATQDKRVTSNLIIPSDVERGEFTTLVINASSLSDAFDIDNIKLEEVVVDGDAQLVNGDFSSSTGVRFLTPPHSIIDGAMNFDDSGSGDLIFDTSSLIEDGDTYNFNFEVLNGNVRIQEINSSPVFQNFFTGIHSASFTNNTGNSLAEVIVEFVSSAGATVSNITNISITKV